MSLKIKNKNYDNIVPCNHILINIWEHKNWKKLMLAKFGKKIDYLKYQSLFWKIMGVEYWKYL